MPLAYIEFIGGGWAPASPPDRPMPAPTPPGPVDPGWGYRPPTDPGYGRPSWGPVDPGWGYRPPVDPGYGHPGGSPGYPSTGPVRPGGPVDPGWGYRPPTDPGYGRPGFFPGYPSQGLPVYPSTGPIYGGVGGPFPTHPIYRPDKPMPLPPEVTPPELPPPYSEQMIVLVYTPGQGWQMQAYPEYPSQGLPPTAAPKPA